MMKFEIKHRWNGSVLFTADIECFAGATEGVKIGLAVKWAVKSDADLTGADLTRANLAGADLTGADLTDANLTGADLTDANLTRANLAGAYLTGAYLARANLAGAYLTGAYLTDANLTGADLTRANLAGADLTGAYLARANLAGADLTRADLTGADLAGADLTDADLTGADLTGADLTGADLTGAYLTRAYLTGANLAGAKWRDGITITKTPIQISGLQYPAHILDTHIQIGCELHSHDEWASFDDARISMMDGLKARRFWQDNKDVILAIAKNHAPSPASAETTGEASGTQQTSQGAA